MASTVNWLLRCVDRGRQCRGRFGIVIGGDQRLAVFIKESLKWLEMMGSVNRGARNGQDDDTYSRQSKLALDAPPRSSTRDVEEADNKRIEKLSIRGDSVPDAECSGLGPVVKEPRRHANQRSESQWAGKVAYLPAPTASRICGEHGCEHVRGGNGMRRAC